MASTTAHVTVHLGDEPDQRARTSILGGETDQHAFASVYLTRDVVLMATEPSALEALAATLSEAGNRLREAQHARQVIARQEAEDAALDARLDALHGPGTATALEAAHADGSIFSERDDDADNPSHPLAGGL